MARITVINDEPAFLDAMYAILATEAGHNVSGFDGDETQIAQVVASNPDLLIVDLRIGPDRIKGWEFALMCRADPALAQVPLIVCSGDVKTMRERADEFRRYGVFTLEKPFAVFQLEAAVLAALAGSRAELGPA
jgi:DNA-binding response OmpR family regulator